MRTKELLAILAGDVPGALPDRLSMVRAGGLTAVFAPAALWAGTGRKARLRAAVRRQEQLEALMPFGTVIPLLPGTRITPGAAAAMLAANAPFFDRLAARLDGLAQFQVTVAWPEARALDHFRSGTGPFAAAASVADLARDLAGMIRAALSGVAGEMTELPVSGDVFFNAALLVPSSGVAALDRALERIDALWPDGFRIRQVGPSPAVSFASVTLKRIPAGGIAAAHALFGLPPSASAEEIRDRRRVLLKAAAPEAREALRSAAEVLLARTLVPGASELHLAAAWGEGKAGPSALRAAA